MATVKDNVPVSYKLLKEYSDKSKTYYVATTSYNSKMTQISNDMDKKISVDDFETEPIDWSEEIK